MKISPYLLFFTVFFAGGCQSIPGNPNPAAKSDVTVNFEESDKYTDVRDSVSGPTSQYYLDEIGKYLKGIAAERLTAGQKLVVTFTDIDLAGDITPGQLNDIRIIKAIYMPRMTLRFQLFDAGGAVIKEGERRLTDMDFQQNGNIIRRGEPLYYDKALIADWVRREFKPL